jgi:hypothetical protein
MHGSISAESLMMVCCFVREEGNGDALPDWLARWILDTIASCSFSCLALTGFGFDVDEVAERNNLMFICFNGADNGTVGVNILCARNSMYLFSPSESMFLMLQAISSTITVDVLRS